MEKFTFKRKLPVWKIILGFIAIGVGIVSIFSSFKGFISIGIGKFLLLI